MNRKLPKGLVGKTMRAFLALCMVALMVPAVAFAADDTTETVTVDATNSDQSVLVGNVNERVGIGVDVYAKNGHSATATTGSITAQDCGLDAASEGSESSTTVTVNGDVNVSPSGDRWSSTGVYADSWSGSTTTVTVNGNVTATGSEYAYDVGVYAYSGYNGTTTVNVNGDVQGSGTGACLEAYESNGTVNLAVDGDVTGGEYGIYASRIGSGTMNALVTGTIDGKDVGIVTENVIEDLPEVRGASKVAPAVTNSLVLTVWRIVLNGDGFAAGITAPMPQPMADGARGKVKITQDEAFEKTIKYIIKVEQPKAGGAVSVTDENGNALEKSYGYQIAYEGDKVLLKVDVESGYELKAAYNGKGEKVELVKGSDGNYYVVVPKGGGVYLSVDLEKVSYTGDDPTEGPDNPNNPPADDQASPTKVASDATADGSGLPKTADGSMALIALLTVALAGAVLMLGGAAASRRRQAGGGERID